MPSPIDHATPDVELANAQLELARAESALGAEPQPDGEPLPEPQLGEKLYEDELQDEALNAAEAAGVQAAPDGGGALALPGPTGVADPRPRPRARLIGFLEGSWRELQRVQWPDRRQVMQATAVVLGFVIVAGVFLGVADTAASHLMNYILTGK
jgi:preprotein translocase subunit SecE